MSVPDPEPDQYDGALAWSLDADHPTLYAQTHDLESICLTCNHPACDTCLRRHALWDCSWCKPCAEAIGCYPLNR